MKNRHGSPVKLRLLRNVHRGIYGNPIGAGRSLAAGETSTVENDHFW